MKRVVIAGAVGGLVLVGALTYVTAVPTEVAAAEPNAMSGTELIEGLLGRAVAQGFLSEEQADKVAEQFFKSKRFRLLAAAGARNPDRVRDRVNRRTAAIEKKAEQKHDKDVGQRRFAEHQGTEAFRTVVREQLAHIPQKEIQEAIKDGTVNELIDVGAIVDAVIADAEASLDRLVAAGRITQGQADKKLESLTRRLEAFETGETDISRLLKRQRRSTRLPQNTDTEDRRRRDFDSHGTSTGANG